MIMIPETIMLRCIDSCLETSRYYASKGNRPLADWWDDRAKLFAHRLVTKSEGKPKSTYAHMNLLQAKGRLSLSFNETIAGTRQGSGRVQVFRLRPPIIG